MQGGDISLKKPVAWSVGCQDLKINTVDIDGDDNKNTRKNNRIKALFQGGTCEGSIKFGNNVCKS